MSKVLVAYVSLTGKTEKMAEYIAEGVRFGGQQATVAKVSDLKNVNAVNGYDGYIFGSPTYHLDMAEPMKTFLFLARRANLQGKLAGSFGSYTHTSKGPENILDTMIYVFKMIPFELGSFKLKEELVETTEGMRTCQDYGKVFGQKVGG